MKLNGINLLLLIESQYYEIGINVGVSCVLK